jgi:hypothetical protein
MPGLRRPAARGSRTASPALRGRVLAAVRSDPALRLADRSPAGGAGRALLVLAALACAAWLAAALLSPLAGRSFAGTVLAGAHGASAVLREQSGQSELTVAGMAPPAPGRTYEVWLAAGEGAPRATDALFAPARSGAASVAVPGRLRGIREVLVTSEPLGGSSTPTAPPALRVRLAAEG